MIKLAKATIKEKYADQFEKGNVTIWSIGKKGYEHFVKNSYNVTDTYKDIFLHLNFENVQKAAQAAMKAFEKENLMWWKWFIASLRMRQLSVLK